jgi:hypothetical protein
VSTRVARACCGTAGVLLALLVSAGAAYAGPWWRLSARLAPTNLAPGEKGLLVASADDLGDTGVDGNPTPVTITDTLPQGLHVDGPVRAYRPRPSRPVETKTEKAVNWSCPSDGPSAVFCAATLAIAPYERLELEIPVQAGEPAGTVATPSNELHVQGGEAEGGGTVPSASLVRPVHINAAPTTFGLEEEGYSIIPEEDGGAVDTHAGSHPFQLTSTVDLNETVEETDEGERPAAPALARDLAFMLPPGLLGDVTAVPTCSEAEFSTLEGVANRCPPDSAIGVAAATVTVPNSAGYTTLTVPVFNLKPAYGEPARFGFVVARVPIILDASVRTDGDYGVTVSVSNATEAAQLLGAQVTFWGQPDAESHDHSRGWPCLDGYYKEVDPELHETCNPPTTRSTTPFLTLPTACGGPLVTLLEGSSWTGDQLSSAFTFQDETGQALPRLQGCQELPFNPSIDVTPVQEDQAGAAAQPTTSTSTPTGLNADVTVPQQGTLQAEALGDADVKSTSVTLPEGVLVNPSAANGLQACSEQQVGYLSAGSSSDPFAPATEEPARFSSEPATCPEASKIGLVRIRTPLLGEELEGAVYLAAQDANPFGSLIALYIVAENPALGLRVKLAGEGSPNGQTGQITTTFQDTPQVPFEELKLSLFGGPHAALSTPASCGAYATQASFTPWSGTPAVGSSSSFQITSGADGMACADPQPLAPALAAGATSPQAGAYTNFTLQLQRADQEQQITGLTVHLPPGNAAILKNVTPCPEPQASEGTCGPQSEIGQDTATAGVGPDPYTVTGGRVYITGPYQGAPYGLSIVTPAVAGPFNLGNVVVRSKIEIDPHTAQVTIVSSLPTFVQGVGMPSSGIPLDLRNIDVTIDRPSFEYNPTNCNPQHVQASVTGVQNTTAQVSAPFQVTGCSSLHFKPTVTAASLGHTSKADGASLKLTFKSKTGEAHVAKTILTIPATLPARLTTIQKACVAAVFEANPAACPQGSDIGTAVVHTPVLKNPLTGPIYLVSHGNAAWPDAELVLQGEGVTVILDGQTAIKKGVTTSSFLSVPDAPFESVEASLPEGPHSALTTNLPLKDHYSLCGQHLTIPTQLGGQNGATVNQNIKVAIQGCGGVKASQTKKLTRTQRLARALKACRGAHRRSRARRASCERLAHRRVRREGEKTHRAKKT